MFDKVWQILINLEIHAVCGSHDLDQDSINLAKEILCEHYGITMEEFNGRWKNYASIVDACYEPAIDRKMSWNYFIELLTTEAWKIKKELDEEFKEMNK